jgi:hypothetical protein
VKLVSWQSGNCILEVDLLHVRLVNRQSRNVMKFDLLLVKLVRWQSLKVLEVNLLLVKGQLAVRERT